MDIELLEQKANKIFKRTEVRFRVQHPGESTPKRDLMREKLSALVNANKNLVVVDEMSSRFGRGETRGLARVYEDLETLGDVEPEYLIKRNNLQDAIPKKQKKAAE